MTLENFDTSPYQNTRRQSEARKRKAEDFYDLDKNNPSEAPKPKQRKLATPTALARQEHKSTIEQAEEKLQTGAGIEGEQKMTYVANIAAEIMGSGESSKQEPDSKRKFDESSRDSEKEFEE